jgi:hypothetical protein
MDMDNLFSNIQQSFNKSGFNKSGFNKTNLLNQQQVNQQKINELLDKSADAIMCGPSCQKLRITEELKQKYLDAETNMQTAPIKLEESKKNYYVYSEGSSYYDNMKEEELTKKANTISQMLSDNFNEELLSANTMNSYLNTALTNSQYTKDLLNNYLEKNKILKVSLRDQRGDILTNDRKTYYETDALQRLKLWYRLLWYLYYIVVLMLVISLIYVPNNLSIIKKVVLIVLTIFYPYFINYIVKWVYNIGVQISNRIPKNVYNNL